MFMYCLRFHHDQTSLDFLLFYYFFLFFCCSNHNTIIGKGGNNFCDKLLKRAIGEIGSRIGEIEDLDILDHLIHELDQF